MSINKFFSSIYNGQNYRNEFYTKEKRLEQSISDDGLEQELKLYRENLEIENKQFETDLENNREKLDYNSNNFLEYNDSNKSYNNLSNIPFLKTMTTLFLEGWVENNESDLIKDFGEEADIKKVTLKKHGDVIKYIYLEIEFPKEDIFNMNNLDTNIFESLSLKDRFDILKLNVEFNSGGQRFIKSNLLELLFLCICQGENIKELENKIQIPLFVFNSSELVANKIERSGYPVIAIQYHEIRLIFEGVLLKNKNIKLNLIINYDYYDNDDRKKVAISNHEILTLQTSSQFFNFSSMDNKLYINLINKCLLCYVDYIDTHLIKNMSLIEYKSNIPNIIGANLIFLEDKVETDREEFESEDMLSFEILGIKIIILPLSEEFSSWDGIKHAMKKPNRNFKNSGLNFSRVDANKIGFKFDYDYNSSFNDKNLIINVIGININIIRVMSGMNGMAYSS